MTIDDRHQLNALLRAIMSAKFSADPLDLDVPASSIVADIANRLADELARGDPSVAVWRDAEGHDEKLRLIRRRIAGTAAWAAWSRDERIDYIKILLSPLVASTALLDDLVSC